MVDANPSFDVGKQKFYSLHFSSVHGDWSANVLTITCSPVNRPMATVRQDARHMQLTTHAPTHSAPKRHVHLISTCVE